MSTIQEKIAARLRERLDAVSVDVFDDSAQHAGHLGARVHGGGHYTVRLASPRFTGKRPLDRHRMVYDALGELMRSEIHALRIEAADPV